MLSVNLLSADARHAHLLIAGQRRAKMVAVQPAPRGQVLQPDLGPVFHWAALCAVLALHNTYAGSL